MTVNELIKRLNLNNYTKNDGCNKQITGGYTSDLLSDVMGKAKEGNVWVTVQNHINVVAVASLKDLSAVIFVNGISPTAEMIEKAAQENIILLSTQLNSFEISGEIYNLLKDNA